MVTEKSIKYFLAASAVAFAILLGLLFHIPGFLFGAIMGLFGAVMLYEKLHGFLPENRRRRRQTLRNEGFR